MSSLPFSLHQTIELKIESLTNQGAGLGRFEGFVVFVDQTAPGDVAEVRISKIKKNFALGELVRVIHASSLRDNPQCPVFGLCGGCQWQHIQYPQQLIEKKKIITDALKKLAKIDSWPEFSVLPSPKQYNYRNRIQLQIKSLEVGYHARGSHKLVKVDSCPIAEKGLSEAIPSLTQKTQAPRVELRIENGDVKIYPSHEELDFTQVNSGQNENLIAAVLEEVERQPLQTVYDLYCGSGNFSFQIAQQFPELHIVASDINAQAIAKANGLAQKAGLTSVEFFAEDSLKTISLHPAENKNALVLIDPPRDGCSQKLLDTINSGSLDRILYISCNPASFARDLQRLNENHPWEMVNLCAFDMFPQTPHVEMLAVLKRTNAAPH